ICEYLIARLGSVVRTSISSHPHAEHQGLRAEVETPVCLVAVPDAQELEDAVLVDALFDAQELAMLVRIGGAEIDASLESGHQELVGLELADEDASGGFGIARGATVAGRSVGDDRVPRSEGESLCNFALFLGDRLQLAFEIKESDLAGHGGDQTVVLG